MRLLQALLLRLIALGVVCGGALLLIFSPSELYAMLVLPRPDSEALRILLAAIVVAVALAAVIPFPVARAKRRNISFPDAHGNTVFHLESVEATLTKSISKMREVKKPHIKLLPAEDKRRVRVQADVALVKAAGESARDVTQRVSHAIGSLARSILGADEVTAVDLHVRDIAVEGGIESLPATPAPVEAFRAPTTATLEMPATDRVGSTAAALADQTPAETAVPLPDAVPIEAPGEEDYEYRPVAGTPAALEDDSEPSVMDDNLPGDVLPEPIPDEDDHSDATDFEEEDRK